MLKKQRKPSINNEKGMAIFEMIPIMVVIILFLNFSLGFFGAVHTGILNSIAARNYAFETFRNRSNLVYFRDMVNEADANPNYASVGHRIHGVTGESSAGTTWTATTRMIDFFDFQPRRAAEMRGQVGDHNTTSWDVKSGERFNKGQGVNPIWIKTQYGICITAQCGSDS